MPKYRKKPIVYADLSDSKVEAVRYTSRNGWTFRAWSDAAVIESPTGESLEIKTLEGIMTATVGDWIIKGIKGEFYPIKNDIFEATYEPV